MDGVVKPVMEKFPYAWLFFIPYILITTFAVLNLFIAVIVNAMQTEHEAARKEEERAVCRGAEKARQDQRDRRRCSRGASRVARGGESLARP